MKKYLKIFTLNLEYLFTIKFDMHLLLGEVIHIAFFALLLPLFDIEYLNFSQKPVQGIQFKLEIMLIIKGR
jgi:hypothetical protein